jgi:hypothetical protein
LIRSTTAGIFSDGTGDEANHEPEGEMQDDDATHRMWKRLVRLTSLKRVWRTMPNPGRKET